MATFLAGALAATLSVAQTTADTSCQLRYPIVLSHHWSARAICSPRAPATGAAACVQVEDYDKYCARKTADAQGQRACAEWRVPPDEETLPPRNVNASDPSLTRNVSAYHRYFSKAIVERLRGTCGNAVYIADKPAFASYEVRARSLRNTVNEALAREHADKVILIGFSQGVQDARYLVARLPVDDQQPAKGTMRTRVAALVSLAGEDGGAESASLTLDVLALSNQGNWADVAKAIALTGDQDVNDTTWKRTVNGQPVYVLNEHCRGPECNLNTEARYRSALHSLHDLSTQYMRPTQAQQGEASLAKWQPLKDYLGIDHARWSDVIPPSLEADNGVQYLGYGARIQNWQAAWGGTFTQDFIFFASAALSSGANDGFVSVRRQVFANPAGNFQQVKTLDGSILGRGYHHLFFSGRNDALYAPPGWAQEGSPYKGSAADVYQQVARDLKARGF
jgi:pimeloyl-ACP methyl ester carboxylesterase